MKFLNGDVWEAWRARDTVAKLVEAQWPARTAYWLAVLHRKTVSRGQVIEGVRMKLVQQYGTPNEDGSTSVKAENQEAFIKAFDELMSEEQELGIEPITLPDTLTPISGALLEPIVPFLNVPIEEAK